MTQTKKISEIKAVFLILILLSLFSLNSFSQTKGTLSIKFTTTTYGGGEAPKHILAAWVTNSAANSSSTYIKTLDAYTQNASYKPYLVKWKAASSYNTTDATTGATLNSHGSVTGSWNALNTLSATVPDGTYYVWIEFTEASTTGKYAVFTFTKGATATTAFVVATSSPNITMNTLSWVPTNTAVEEVPAGKNYKIFPNPISDYVNITGSSFKKANVYNSVGKLILTSTVNKINLSKYPTGAYVVEIVSEDGTFYRKALKK